MKTPLVISLAVATIAALGAFGAQQDTALASFCDRHPDHWKCRSASPTATPTPSPTPTPTPSATPTPTPSATPTPTPTPSSGNDTCGQQLGTAPPAQWSHVVWIVMENKAYGQIIGSSSAPYTNSLASKCGLATNYSAVAHPSLPNYIAMTSGGTQGVSDDASPASHPLNVPSIFSQLPNGASGSLEESMPSNCLKSDAYPYAVKHNPEAYYTNLGSDCANNDVRLGSTPDVSRRFTFVTPNMCNDTHDCSISTGDAWLAGFIPKIVATPDYQAGKTVIFLTYDEDDSSSSNHIVTEVISAHTAPGTRSSSAFTHYNLLGTTEDLLGLPRLGNAVGKASMAPAFGLGGSTSTSPPTSSTTYKFADEFDGPAGQAPDSMKWTVYGGSSPPSWGVECFADDRQHVALDGNGHLVLTATAASTTPCAGDAEPGIISGGMETGSRSMPKFTFQYGVSEARIAFDCLAGEWPTYWHSGGTTGVSWPTDGEIDVLEGFSGGTVINQGLWMAKSGGGSGQIHSNWSGQWCGTGFHTYRVRWEPGKISFYVDGTLKKTWTPSDAQAAGLVWPFDTAGYVQRIIAELSLGGAAGTVDRSHLPIRETIDYIRVAAL